MPASAQADTERKALERQLGNVLQESWHEHWLNPSGRITK